MEKNSARQIRVPLEMVGEVLLKFEEEVIADFDMKGNSSAEIQRRGVGINFEFGEEIHRSDDELIYYLKEDKAVAMAIIRRTSFNNAEITLIETDERKFGTDFAYE